MKNLPNLPERIYRRGTFVEKFLPRTASDTIYHHVYTTTTLNDLLSFLSQLSA